MRMNKTTLSSIACIIVLSAAASYVSAQSARIKNPAAIEKLQQNQTKYLPPASAAPRTNLQNLGSNFQQGSNFQANSKFQSANTTKAKDIEVPSILGGKNPAPAALPPTKPAVTSKQKNDTPEYSTPSVQQFNLPTPSMEFEKQAPMRQAPMRQAARIENQNKSRMQKASWQTLPLRNPAVISAGAMQATQAISTQTENRISRSVIKTASPKITVEAIGPHKITIGKLAKYEVIVRNEGQLASENIIVGIDFPSFVEINESQPSIGSREITDGSQEARIIWNLPILEASATEKITIEVTPIEARHFDVNVQWTFRPIIGKTNVEVTEPKLAIQIAGPNEVQFGEKALYNVTVSNPGTGTAENVTVMLPEALGGERASLGQIEPGNQRQFQVELIARSAGTLELTTTVAADGNLSEADTRSIVVRRAELEIQLAGPAMKYAGTTARYQLLITNIGDAMAKDIIAAVALPKGVEYISGIDAVEKIDGGIRWNVGMLSPGNERGYEILCSVNKAGDVQIEAATRGSGDLAATDSIVTKVEAVADLVLSVQDPKGPLPTGQKVDYEIKIKNRGTKSAREVKVLMQFGDGIEPVAASGLSHDILTGQVVFTPISQIEPNQEIVLVVTASAQKPGPHRFRAQLVCEESESHEVAEGTTKFFGESETSSERSATDNGNQFKR